MTFTFRYLIFASSMIACASPRPRTRPSDPKPAPPAVVKAAAVEPPWSLRSPYTAKYWPTPLGRTANADLLWTDDTGLWAVGADGAAPRRLVLAKDIARDWVLSPDGTWAGDPDPSGVLRRYSTTDGSALEPVALPTCKPKSTIYYSLDLHASGAAAGGCEMVPWVKARLEDVASAMVRPISGVVAGSKQNFAMRRDQQPLYVVFTTKGAAAFDVKTGQRRWSSDIKDTNCGGAVAPDGRVVAVLEHHKAGPPGAYLLDATTGKSLSLVHERRHPSEGGLGFLGDGRLWTEFPSADGTKRVLRRFRIGGDRAKEDGAPIEISAWRGYRVLDDGSIMTVEDGLLVIRGPEGELRARVLGLPDGGSAVLHADGRHACSGEGCRFLSN